MQNRRLVHAGLSWAIACALPEVAMAQATADFNAAQPAAPVADAGVVQVGSPLGATDNPPKIGDPQSTSTPVPAQNNSPTVLPPTTVPLPAYRPLPQSVMPPPPANATVTQPAAMSPRFGPAPLDSETVAVKGKWNPTLYGFVELDMIRDSTQSLTGVSPGYLPLARPGTYASQYGRTIFDVRGSRFGFRLAAPETDGIKATALIEADFLGNQLPTAYPSGPGSNSEYSFSTNPMLRIRHAALRVQTPIVDVLAGQYWQLFGWQPYFFPLSAQIPAYPGELYSRAPQVRVSHKFDADVVSLEAAVAAARPPQRNADFPDAQAGLRFLVGHWVGVLATGFTGAYEQAAGIGVSGVYRKFRVPEFTDNPTSRREQTGKGLSIDALLPLVPARVKDKGNALTLTGSFSVGTGISDLYTPGTPGNAGFPTLPNPNALNPAPVWPQDIDNGLVTYGADGRLRTIDWQMYIVGGQYYLPPSGRVWLGGNYGRARSGNLASLGLNPTQIIPKYTFWDAVAFVEVTVPVILGLEYAQIKQTYADNTVAKNSRVQLSAYYIFY